jgi:hypothetical protein
MEKEIGQFRVVETDDGLRVEIKGEKFKEMFSCCWLPMCCGSKSANCCPPDDKK